MPSVNGQMFEHSPVLRVLDVALQATDSLESYREKLARVVLDEMHQFVALLDPNGNVLEMNPSTLEAEARWWAVSEQTKNLQRDLVQRARSGEFVRSEMEIYSQADGEETIIIDFSLTPVKDRDGKVVFILAEGRNITEKGLSEQRWRAVFENSAIGMALLDPQGSFLNANSAYQKIVGYSEDELHKLCLSEITHEDDRESTLQNFQELLTGSRKIWQSELRYRRNDGTTIWVNVHGSVPSTGAAPQVVITIVEDITERKLAVEALQESQRRLELSVKASNAGPWEWRVATDEVYLSPVWKSQLGYADSEIPNRLEEWEKLLHPAERERVLAHVRTFAANPRPDYELEHRLRHKDGSYRWILSRASALLGADGKPYHMVGLDLDITERKWAEDRLSEYEKVVEGSQEMIVVLDRDYRYLIANRAFLHYRGLERKQVLGHCMEEFLPADAFTIAKTKLEECFQGKVVKYEMKFKYPHLGERDLLISYFPIEGVNGIDRVGAILQDVTERRQTEAAVRVLSGRLLKLQDEERRHLARELHESPAQMLAALCMNLAVVNESVGVLDSRSQRAMTESISLAEECLRQIRTVSYLLHPPELDELGLQSALTRYIDGFAQRSGILVDVEVSPDLGRLPQQMETTIFRMVQECLTNIHRHSGSKTARLRLRRGPAEILLEVEDAGNGIRGDAAPGVGISSMRERAQQLDGNLEVRSDPSGTTVQAIFPLSKAAA